MIRTDDQRRRVLFAALVVLQIAALILIAADRHSILANGRRVILHTTLVERRSLATGEYLGLSYPFSALDLAELDADAALQRGEDESPESWARRVHEQLRNAYVTLRQTGSEDAREAVAISKAKPVCAEGELLIRGSVTEVSSAPNGLVWMRYGIETLCVPGTVVGLWQGIRLGGDENTSVEVAIDQRGRATPIAIYQNGAKKVWR